MDSVGIAFELMRLELEAAVEDLNSEGAKHFQVSGYEEARTLTKKGEALQDFCERISKLADEWNEEFQTQYKDITDTVAADQTAKKILSASKSSRTGLLVRFLDGRIITEKTAAETLVKCIALVGFEKVEELQIMVNKENIVSERSSNKYSEIFNDPYFVKTHSSTMQKKKHLDIISDKLNLGLEVSII